MRTADKYKGKRRRGKENVRDREKGKNRQDLREETNDKRVRATCKQAAKRP